MQHILLQRLFTVVFVWLQLLQRHDRRGGDLVRRPAQYRRLPKRYLCKLCMTSARALSIYKIYCCCVNYALHCVKALAMCTKALAMYARGVSLWFALNEQLLGLRAVLFTMPVFFPMSRVLAGGGSVAGAMTYLTCFACW